MSCSNNGGGGDKARVLERVSNRKFYAQFISEHFFSKRPRILQNHHGNTSPVIIPQCRGWAAGGSYEVSTDGLILSASLLARTAVVLTTHAKGMPRTSQMFPHALQGMLCSVELLNQARIHPDKPHYLLWVPDNLASVPSPPCWI